MKKNQCILIKMLSHYYTNGVKSDIGEGAFYGVITDELILNNQVLYICDCTELEFTGYRINQFLIIGPEIKEILYMNDGFGHNSLRYRYCVFSKTGRKITKKIAKELYEMSKNGNCILDAWFFRHPNFIIKPDLTNEIKTKYFKEYFKDRVDNKLQGVGFNFSEKIFDIDSEGTLLVIDKNKIIGQITIPLQIGDVEVKRISKYTFMDCTNLTDVIIPETVEVIEEGAFDYCINLKSVVIPKSVEVVERYVFQFCTNLKSVVFQNPDTRIGYQCFYYCTSLEEISLPDNLSKIDSLFENCINLKNIKIPDTVRTINMASFYSCKNLVEVNIPNSVKSIGGLSFAKCENLERVKMSDSLESFSPSGFINCNKLKEITLPATVEHISGYAIIDEQMELTIDKNNNTFQIYGGSLYSKDKMVFIV